MMTNGDPEGRIFLSYPHANNGSFSCSPLFLFIYLFKYLFFYLFIYLFKNKVSEVPAYAKMQFNIMALLDVLGKIAWVR